MVNSIGDCYQIWKKENQNTLNPLTFHRYNNLLERHLLPYFADAAARDITEQEIDLFVNKKKSEGMSEVALNMLIMLLKRLLRTAGVDTVKLGLEHTVRIRANKRTVEVMKKVEQEQLDMILNTSHEPKYLGICLAFKMGLSIGEICALTWEDVNLEKGILQVRNTVQRIQNKEENEKKENYAANACVDCPNKTLLVNMPLSASTQRELPVPDAVLQDLQMCESRGYVLQCREGKIPDPRREQIRLSKLCEKNRIKGCNFHTLRDTFAVRCLEAGMSVENLSYVLGHASVAVTAARYKEFMGVKQEHITVLRKIMELV